MGEAAKAGDSWQDGNYGDAVIHEITGFFELALFAEDRVVSVYNSFAGMITKDVTFKTTEALIKAAGELTPTRAGALQGTIRGANIDRIFETLSRGGRRLASEAVELSNGTTIYKYQRTSTQNSAIFIKTLKESYKITILP